MLHFKSVSLISDSLPRGLLVVLHPVVMVFYRMGSSSITHNSQDQSVIFPTIIVMIRLWVYKPHEKTEKNKQVLLMLPPVNACHVKSKGANV